ncbi:type VI secretion system ImpM family protein [Yoonia maricola]|uniref:Type VI secretion system ImpM family protein n=2 Tax=Yoonia maricola TaxID=420999 RepID=A0A2M8VZX3_9RHOB|nr:type VI secretion system ImpM family protein [Yoonia maricola]
MNLVIYGKHPAFGDFLAHGLEHQILHRFDVWLEGVLPVLRKDLAENWEAAWAAAPPLYFWLGPDVLGAPLFGLFMPSHDKVGRRFPLIFGLTGVVTSPPVHQGYDDTAYRALEAHVAAFTVPKDGTRGAQTLTAGFEIPQVQGVPFEAGQDGTIWGHREDGDLGKLFQDALTQDADKAQLHRSHWWHAALPNRSAGWLATNGLPDLAALSWLLCGRERTPAQPQAQETETIQNG